MKTGIHHIDLSYPGQIIFHDFTLEFREKTITCILGPSGCGKTTLLNILSGNRRPDAGERTGFEGKKISYIFQEPRLLPWKTVSENLLFPIIDQISPEQRKELPEHYLELVSLKGKGDLYPHQLSGGMKQRVSMARAFAYPSDIILMDEAFRGLDLSLKKNLMDQFVKIWEKHPRTVVAVTHDVDEALSLGHELIVFSQSPVRVMDRILLEKEGGKLPEGIRDRLIGQLLKAGEEAGSV